MLPRNLNRSTFLNGTKVSNVDFWSSTFSFSRLNYGAQATHSYVLLPLINLSPSDSRLEFSFKLTPAPFTISRVVSMTTIHCLSVGTISSKVCVNCTYQKVLIINVYFTHRYTGHDALVVKLPITGRWQKPACD